MSLEIQKRGEAKRGCGYRKGGGIYLVGDSFGADCGRLPIPLEVCPTCHGGIKPTRGWTWIDPIAIAQTYSCTSEIAECDSCPMNDQELPRQAGLLWIGEKFYPLPEDFLREGAAVGLSRRISAIPNDFVVGETLVLLAHRMAVPAVDEDSEPTPAIFAAFTPSAIEYVVSGEESDEELESLVDRGMTLVSVEKAEQSTRLVDGERIQ